MVQDRRRAGRPPHPSETASPSSAGLFIIILVFVVILFVIVVVVFIVILVLVVVLVVLVVFLVVIVVDRRFILIVDIAVEVIVVDITDDRCDVVARIAALDDDADRDLRCLIRRIRNKQAVVLLALAALCRARLAGDLNRIVFEHRRRRTILAGDLRHALVYNRPRLIRGIHLADDLRLDGLNRLLAVE